MREKRFLGTSSKFVFKGPFFVLSISGAKVHFFLVLNELRGRGGGVTKLGLVPKKKFFYTFPNKLALQILIFAQGTRYTPKVRLHFTRHRLNSYFCM